MRTFLILGACAMAVAVVLGAFGAHGLRARVSPEALSAWQTAVQYHLIHALALVVLGLLLQQFPALTGIRVAGWILFSGIVLFSGSLYLLVLMEWRFLGPVTPLGGLAFIAGWLWLAWVFFADGGNAGS